jgi:hypothetical protein
MQFYRGISVPRDAAGATIRKIRAHGLQPGDGQWTMLAADLKPRLAELWSEPTITLEDTRPKTSNPSWVCACGEEQGALYYAYSHNRTAANDTPILIVFKAHFSEAIVDGRDFLYTVFQVGDPKRSRPIIERIFGSAILRYADRAWSGDGKERVPICDLAVQDNAVVRAHAASRTVIAGRYRTRFRSAFLVRTPVAADRILDVRVVDGNFELPAAEVSLDDIR